MDGPESLLRAGDSLRVVTNDFMFYSGDGFTMFKNGANVKAYGDLLLDVVIDYIIAKSPIEAKIEGCIVKK
jgi:2',3'-cyclic-nucleotide 2'-phosphodiesterase (5'-nucleotidase family)